MNSAELISALRTADPSGLLPVEVFVDTRRREQFVQLREVAAEENSIVLSTVPPEFFNESVGVLPKPIGKVLADLGRKLNLKRGSEL